MNAKKKKYGFLCLMAGVLLALSSCRHKDLCYEETTTSQIEVVFDWCKAPTAKVASMRIFLYPSGGGSVITYEFANMQGGFVRLPEGDYRAICINSDTEAMHYKDIHTFEDFQVFTSMGTLDGVVLSALQTEDKGLAYSVRTSPDKCYSDNLKKVQIRAATGSQKIVFFPEMTFCRYQIKLINVANFQYISPGRVIGGISGLSEVFYVGRRKMDSDSAIIPFSMKKEDDNTLIASFFTLGQTRFDDEHHVAIRVVLRDGSEVCYVYDVTRQIHDAPDPHDVFILLDGMQLPATLDFEKEERNDGGFSPSLDEWEDVSVDLDM